MRPFMLVVFLCSAATGALAQTFPYILKPFAGSFPLGDGGPATQALLNSPRSVVVDAANNLYVLDSLDYRIRKFSINGNISTIATFTPICYDMKMTPDGSFY